MKKVLVLGELTPPYDLKTSAEDGLELIREIGTLEPSDLINRVQKDPLIKGIICPLSQPITESVLQELPQIEIIANVAVGVDNIDLVAAKKYGVKVSHTPYVLTESTADLAWALLLGGARRLVEGDRLVRSGAWTGWSMNQFLGQSLGNSECNQEQESVQKSIGIVGLGQIGHAIARRSVGFNMKVYYANRTRKIDSEQEYGWQYLKLDNLIKHVDFLVLSLALTPETEHILNEKRLLSMKKNAYLVNIGRGALIDEEALIRVLENGHLSGAGLDVYEQEPYVPRRLRALRQVTLLPHLGSATLETRREMSRLSLESVRSCLLGEELKGYFKVY